MATAGSIVVDLLARTGSFETDMDRAAKVAKRRADEIDKALSAIGTAAATAGAAAAGALALLVNQTMNSAREIERMAQISNASTSAFQAMAVGAQTVGIEQEKLADILKDVNDRVGDFLSTGGGPMKDFFEQIAPKVGVTADEFARLSGPEALQLYVSSLEKAGVSQQEMTFYLEAMASDTTALIPLLADGGREMMRLGEEAKRTGQIMSVETIAAAAELKSKMDQLSGQVQGAKNIIAEQLIPVLSTAADELIDFGGSGDTAREAAKLLRGVLKELVVGAAEVAAWFQASGKTLGGWAAQASAVFSGDFAGAKFIGQELDKDLAEIEARLRGFRERVRAEGDETKLPPVVVEAPPLPPRRPRLPAGGRASKSTGMSEAEREQQRLMQEGLRVYEQTRTAAEKLSAEYERLNVLKQAGAINQDTYNRAVFEAQEQFDELTSRVSGAAAEQERLNQLLAATPTGQLEAQRETMQFLAQAFEMGKISAAQFQEAAMTALGIAGGEEGDYWTKWLQGAEAALGSFDERAGSVLDNFASSFGSAFESMIFDATSLQEAVAGLAEGMARSMANAVGEMIAQWLAYQAVQLLMGKTTQASAASALTMEALASQQMAALNAFAATAAIPVVGPAAAPAAAAAALAATSPFVATVASLSAAAVGARADGGPVSQHQPYLVGERGPELFVPNTAGRVLPNSELGGRSSAPPVVNIRNINAFDTSVLGDYIGSDAGEQVVMNVVQRNASTIRQLSGGG